MVKIHLKKVKCNQFGQGADIIVGLTNNKLCPVAALSSFMAARRTLPGPGPFFMDKEGTPLIKARFVEEIREVLKAIGLPQGQYAGHSFRIGADTVAAQAGMEDSTIQTLGRWQSAAFLQYIRKSASAPGWYLSKPERASKSATSPLDTGGYVEGCVGPGVLGLWGWSTPHPTVFSLKHVVVVGQNWEYIIIDIIISGWWRVS